MPYLTVVSAKDNARTFPIGTGSLTVGSDPGCDLVFPGLHLAPVHARICAEGGAYTVARAVSDAVVYLNYLPVTEKELAAGDEITLGRLCLRFEDSAEESAAAVRDMVKIVSEDSLATTVESELPSAEAEEPPESAAGRPAEFLEALYRVGSIVNAIHDPERLVDELVELLLEVTRASRACFLVPAGKGEFVPRAAAGIAGEKEGAMLISRSIVGRVARGRRGILCSNASTDDRFKNATSISLGNIRSAICVPVSWKEDDLGILYLDARGFTRDFISFSEADLRLVRAIADQAALALANARRENDLVRENTTLRRRQQQLQFGMVSASPRMNQVLDVISRAAPTAATVLIRGETGTGKEVVARAIHFNSPRADRPLVTVNCAAFPETLLQSELFGHEKGAFTGAAGRKIGKFELAQGGTVFLDEIAELDPKSQVVLLRILESRILQRLGGNEDIPVDVRVIAATNRDLGRAIEDGDFREDLYYRLKVLELFVPPLRERREDIGPLVDYYLEVFAREGLRQVEGVDPGALAVLEGYSWPGNVRELKNALERVLVLGSSSRVVESDLEFIGARGRQGDSSASASSPPGASIREMEKDHILQVLEECGGSRKAAAEKLGINRSTLHRKLKTYGIGESDR